MSRLLTFSLAALLGISPLGTAEVDDLESQFEQEADASSDSDDLEWLLFLEKHPLDLNRATADELSSLPYLSVEEASAIVSYRERIGKFERTDDLQKVEGLDADKVNLLKRYLTVAPLPQPALHTEASLKLKRQTPRPTGFSALEDSSRYLGNDLWLRNGIRVTYGETYRLVLGTSKIPGEEDFADAIGLLIKTIRDLSRLEWLKVTCPKCGEEMTQYLTPQEEVDAALEKGSCLETVCSYCQNKVSLDPRTFEPLH